MIGADILIDRRNRGSVPDVVWLDADAAPVPFGDGWISDDDPLAKHAHLWLGGENPARADLRCVVGLTVHVTGQDRQTVFALRDRCIKSKAKRVIASVMTQGGNEEFPTFTLAECTDTARHLTWPNS